MTSTPVLREWRRGALRTHAGVLLAAWMAVTGAVAQDGPPPLPEGFPLTIPFPEGFQPKLAQRHEQPTIGFLVIGNAPGTVAELAQFYRARLAKRGFEILSENAAPPSTIVLNFDAPGLDHGYVGLVDASDGGGTTLTLALSYDPEEQ